MAVVFRENEIVLIALPMGIIIGKTVQLSDDGTLFLRDVRRIAIEQVDATNMRVNMLPFVPPIAKDSGDIEPFPASVRCGMWHPTDEVERLYLQSVTGLDLSGSMPQNVRPIR